MNNNIESIQAGTDGGINIRVNQLEMDFKNSNLDETAKDKMDKVEKDIADIKEEMNKHNEEAETRNAASGAGELLTRPDGQSEEGRQMREEIEQIKEDARQAEARLSGRIEDANGKLIDLKNDAHKGASQQGNKLLNLKETSVQKLPENASQTDVVSWVEDLTMHLEGATGWTNATELFKALKTAKEPLEGDKLEELIDEVNNRPKNDFKREHFDHQERSKELFRYAFPKLSNKHKVLCCNTKSSMNGLEVLRLIIREHDPIGENISTGLEQRFTNKLKHKCKTLEACRDMVKELE